MSRYLVFLASGVLPVLFGAIGAGALAAQISASGRCAVEGPVFWGQASAVNMTVATVTNEHISAGVIPNMRLEPVSGRVTLDCEEGILVFRQFAVMPDRVWRDAVEVTFDATGDPRILRFGDLGGVITDIGVVLVTLGDGQQKAISRLWTGNLWFDIEGVAAAYNELFSTR